MTRGKKRCKNCNTEAGVRSFVCKRCGTEFKLKPPRKHRRKILVEDFRTLERGDTIQVVGGTGSYYTDSHGQRHYFVERGRYKVFATDSDGIKCYGPNGYDYIYMGKTHTSRLCETITRSRCKILKIQNDGVCPATRLSGPNRSNRR
jgi:hypothetical protein